MAFKIIFLGTPDIAVPSLNALAKDGRFEIVGVVTQPDKPVGRKGTMTPPPVKVAAQELGITIHQPIKQTDPEFRSWIEEVGPTCDAFVVVAYGKIFQDWFLALPKQGLINLHASLLPRWRGASPINAVIASGDEESGVSIMKIVAEMDAGPVLAMESVKLSADETAESLRPKLAELGAKILPDIVENYLEGKIEPKEQDDSKATYCKTLTREDGKIDWSKSAEEIERAIRAYTPWPGTWMETDGKRLKILKGKTIQQFNNSTSSHFISKDGYPSVSCGNNTALELIRVQPEGKGAMDGKAYLAGNHWA